MKKEDPLAKILKAWEALDEETQEAIRAEINLRARQRFDANFQKEEASILKDLRKGFEKQGFSESSASSGAQDQLMLEKFFDLVSGCLQSKEEGQTIVDLLKFIQSKNLTFINELIDIFLETRDERISKLLGEMLVLQRIVQDSSSWQNVKLLTPEETEMLNRAILGKFESMKSDKFDDESVENDDGDGFWNN